MSISCRMLSWCALRPTAQRSIVLPGLHQPLLMLLHCRCSGYQGIPVHLLLGHFNGPASVWEQNDDRIPAKKTLMRRRIMRRTMTKLLRTRRPPREVFLVRGRIRSVPAQHIPVLSKNIRSEDGIPSMLSQQGGDQLLPCLHKATRWLLPPPLKIGWTVQGAKGGHRPSSTHSRGPVPLLYEDQVHRRLKTTTVPLLGRIVATPSPS
jgi:hypothetical protein